MIIENEIELQELLDDIKLSESDNEGYNIAKEDLEYVKKKVFKEFGRMNRKEKIQKPNEVWDEKKLQKYLKDTHGATIVGYERKLVEERKKKEDDFLERHTGARILGTQTGEKSGVLTFLDKFVHPMKGFPDAKKTAKVALLKRLIPLTIEVMYNRLKKIIPEDPKEYCRSVRELHRIMTIGIERSKDLTQKRKFREIRDITCIVLEKDMAYRFFVQDMLSEINLEEVKLDEGDQEYANVKKDYKFGFQQKGQKINNINK